MILKLFRVTAHACLIAGSIDGVLPGAASPRYRTGFKTNPAGAAIVSTVTQLRIALGAQTAMPARRYLVIRDGMPGTGGAVVQIQR